MTLINIRIDESLKNDVEEILNNLGLNMSSAITIYLKAIVRKKGLPFELVIDNNEINKRVVSKPASVSSDMEFDEIKDWALSHEFISVSTIQRELAVGFNKAGRIFKELIEKGIIDSISTPSKGNKVIN